MSYDWIAAFTFVASLVAMTMVGKFIAFRIPAFQEMRELNREVDKTKLAKPRFREAVKVNNRAGLVTNLVFYFAVLPFCVSLDPRPLWRSALDIVAILMIYDFFYYLTHRFLFHGKILRKVHSLHHQARTPTHVDALYVHPLETFIGLCLFLFSIPLVAAIGGAPVNAFAAAFATLVFTQWNTLNHAFVNLPFFPYRFIDNITSVHAAHHVDMNQGNYATMTMLYDKLFGTYEQPVSRSSP